MAGRIPDAFIDQLLGQTDIVRLIGQYVPLKKSGVNYLGCCPFHDEKTPSFSVHSQKQFYHCFGCGASGSAITFLMKHQHMAFVDAIETLAKQAGLTVPQTGGSDKEQEQYRRGVETLQRAQQYFVRQLNAAALEYFHQRGLDNETIGKYGLGYAPKGGYLKSCFGRDFDEALLVRTGLLRPGEKERSPYEFFRERMMFPIRNHRGQVIAFGGRALSDRTPAKYINSPETRWFKKSRTIYGEHELKTSQRDIKTLFVVEGYMDVVSLSRHGVPNAVATLGTAVTEQHLRKLSRLCPNIVFCFDGDEAGHRAAVRTMEQTLPFVGDELSIHFMLLPEQHDPDSFVAAKGAKQFHDLAARAKPLSEFLIDRLTQGGTTDTIEKRSALCAAAGKSLARMPKSAYKTLVTQKVSEISGVPMEELQRAPPADRQRTAPRTMQHGSAPRGIAKRAVTWLLHDPRLAQQVGSRLSELRKASKNDPGVALLCKMLDYILEHNINHAAMVIAHFEGDEHGTFLDKIHKENLLIPPDVDTEFLACLDRIVSDNRKQQRQYISRKVERGEKKKLTPDEQEQWDHHANAPLPAAGKNPE